MNKVRAGVIGVGYLGRFHAEKYAALRDVEFIGVVDSDRDRAVQVAKALQTSAFTDPAQLIGKVDAVSIVVPTVFHSSVAKQFLEKGVHVLLEKPVTVTLDQADELIDLAARNDLILQVGHIERFNPAVTAVRPMIKSPRFMRAERAAPFTVRCTDVSVVLDLMIHDLDIVSDFAGAAPREISATGASIITQAVDVAAVRIVFGNGVVADLVASRVSDEKKRTLSIFEDDSVYSSDYQAQSATVSRKMPGEYVSLTSQPIITKKRDTLADEIDAFLSSVRSGTQPLVSGIEGKRALALAAIIERNILKGITGFVPVPAV